MGRSEEWSKFKAYMLDKYPECEHCLDEGVPVPQRSMDVHHWLIHYDKRFWKLLDREENCGCVCRECHSSGVVNGRASRVKHWTRRLGQGFNMIEWYERLDLRTKERYPGM